MNKIPTYTEARFVEFTLKGITSLNNEFATEAGLKTTKRFGTKPAAIKRALANQQAYVELYAEFEKAQKESTPKKTGGKGKFELTTMFMLGDIPTKTDTAMGIMVEPLDLENQLTAAALIQDFKENFKQKRGHANVDDSFARGYLSGAIRAGHIKMVEEA